MVLVYKRIAVSRRSIGKADYQAKGILYVQDNKRFDPSFSDTLPVFFAIAIFYSLYYSMLVFNIKN